MIVPSVIAGATAGGITSRSPIASLSGSLICGLTFTIWSTVTPYFGAIRESRSPALTV